jgi:hypothetical protein
MSAVINAVRQPGPAAPPEAFGPAFDPVAASDRAELKILTVTISGAASVVLNVLWVDFSSPLLSTDRFVVPKDVYDDSLRQPWLEVGSPVRRLFASEDGGDDENEAGEWLEGIVYHCPSRDELKRDPYNAVSVVWTSQEAVSLAWVYSYSQASCECSPWDLEATPFKKNVHRYRPPALPRCFSVGTLDAASIIDYLKQCNASEQFNCDVVTEFPAFREQFPDKADWLDLKVIAKQAARGRYDGSDHVGIATLFRDLERMVANSKTFNSKNQDFLPWRMADMMEKTVLHIKQHIAKARPSIASLHDALQQDRSMQQEMEMEAAQEI